MASIGDAHLDLLPFPCTELTTPCRDIFHRNEEGRGNNFVRAYYFTIPSDHFVPSPVTFADTKTIYLSTCFRDMLALLGHMTHRLFMGKDPHRRLMEDGRRRFSMFFEYLLNQDAAIDTNNAAELEAVSYLDCVGVRFHIYVFDDSLDLMEGIQAFLSGDDEATPSAGGGDDDVQHDGDHTAFDAAGDPRGAGGSRRNKNDKKKKKKKKDKKKKLAVYEKYVLIDSIHEWFKLCNAVNRRGDVAESDFTLFTDGGDQYVPMDIHPYHADKVFAWEASLVEGMRVEQTRQVTEGFAFPELVYYVTDGYATPFGLLGFTMPRTPRWYEQDDRGIKNTHNALMREAYMNVHFELAESIENHNDMRDISAAQKERRRFVVSKIAERQEQGEDVDVPAELRAFRNTVTPRIAKAWSIDAHVSDAIKAMVPYQQRVGSWTMRGLPVYDRKMSHFGNLVAHMVASFETVYEHSSNHLTQLRMVVFLLDAYRNQCNMHNNILLLGAGSKGKSFMMSCFQDMMVPDTTQFRLYETAKAATTDKDENDVIRLYDEATPAHLGEDKGTGAETGSALMKGLLSECRVKVDSIVVDEGKRKQISIMAEKIGTQCLATNERVDKIPEALCSRYIQIRVHDIPREGFSAVDRAVSTKIVCDVSKDKARATFQQRMRIMQTMVCMVEKAIYLGLLEDVNIQVFTAMQSSIRSYLRFHTAVDLHGDETRNFKAQQRFARTLTIMHAVDKFVHDTRSPGFDPDGTLEFCSQAAWTRLQMIQPYLFCTEEIAFFCIDINSDQVIHSHNYQCVELLTEFLGQQRMVVNSETKEWQETDDGMWVSITGTFTDLPSLYKSLLELQTKDTYSVLLSEENLKVAFNELRAIKFKGNGKSLVALDNSRMRIVLNASFIKKHFNFDDGLGRYVCCINPNTMVREAFLKGYCNRFTRSQQRMVSGSTVGIELPYMLQTFHKNPNRDNVMTLDMPLSFESVSATAGDAEEEQFEDEDDEDEVEGEVEDVYEGEEEARSNNNNNNNNNNSGDDSPNSAADNGFFHRHGSELRFDQGNIEEYFFKMYLKECGFDADVQSSSFERMLVKSHMRNADLCPPNTNYPKTYIGRDLKFMPKRLRECYEDRVQKTKRARHRARGNNSSSSTA